MINYRFSRKCHLKVGEEFLRTVKIKWSYPMLFENIVSDIRVNGIGVYYITRKFGGREKSLYIGKTHDSFYKRLIDHEEIWFGDNDCRGKKYIRLGTIVTSKKLGDEEMNLLIKDVESALIFEMADLLPKNFMGKKTYTCQCDYLCKIISTGFRGEITPFIDMREHL